MRDFKKEVEGMTPEELGVWLDRYYDDDEVNAYLMHNWKALFAKVLRLPDAANGLLDLAYKKGHHDGYDSIFGVIWEIVRAAPALFETTDS